MTLHELLKAYPEKYVVAEVNQRDESNNQAVNFTVHEAYDDILPAIQKHDELRQDSFKAVVFCTSQFKNGTKKQVPPHYVAEFFREYFGYDEILKESIDDKVDKCRIMLMRNYLKELLDDDNIIIIEL